MHNVAKKLRNLNSAGFSLVELMAVVGIIGVLVATGMTNYAAMQIRAGRAEMNLMTKYIYTSAYTYQSDRGDFGTGFSYGIQRTFVSGIATIEPGSCTGTNPLAVSARNCTKLRYTYQYITTGPTSFEVQAYSLHWLDDDGSGSSFGDRPPTKQCKTFPGLSLYFVDWWSLSSNNEMRAYPGNVMGFPVEGDVMKTCF